MLGATALSAPHVAKLAYTQAKRKAKRYSYWVATQTTERAAAAACLLLCATTDRGGNGYTCARTHTRAHTHTFTRTHT
jgi:hypothetical protein